MIGCHEILLMQIYLTTPKSRHTTKLTYTRPNHEQNNKRPKGLHKIIWFNPPFNLDVSTNVAKIFLNLIEKHFPCSSKLHKVFNKSIVKVSYSCTQNMSQVIKGHNKKIFSKETQDCNCRVKTDCPLNRGCRKESVIYKCTGKTCDSKKVYLGLTDESLKKRGIMTMSTLLKTSFMPTVLLFQVMYGK